MQETENTTEPQYEAPVIEAVVTEEDMVRQCDLALNSLPSPAPTFD